MRNFTPMDDTISPTSMLRFTKNAANSTDIARLLAGQTIEEIREKFGDAAAKFAENNHAFGYTISEVDTVHFDGEGRIISFDIKTSGAVMK